MVMQKDMGKEGRLSMGARLLKSSGGGLCTWYLRRHSVVIRGENILYLHVSLSKRMEEAEDRNTDGSDGVVGGGRRINAERGRTSSKGRSNLHSCRSNLVIYSSRFALTMTRISILRASSIFLELNLTEPILCSLGVLKVVQIAHFIIQIHGIEGLP
ncbi:hypothetical protein ARMSODRAFT_982219 [Armillaria solidipes]|uniref:Uncharacterized protein n=1 Tax=Armillaria solidipes TaxID=1076256 RepID=A0A2H3B9M9_9AGAR|nr:hypothetical protein ARMSODRAFT_982219 [Armillaria solidipes]